MDSGAGSGHLCSQQNENYRRDAYDYIYQSARVLASLGI